MLENYRIAFCHPPSLGGPFARFINLKRALEPFGLKFYFVGVGLPGVRLNLYELLGNDYYYIGDGDINDIKEQITQLLALIKEKKINLVLTYGDNISIQAIPYMPPSVKIISICANPSNDASRRLCFNIERISKIIAVSENIKRKLIKKYKVQSAKVVVIPSEVDLFLYPSIEEIKMKQVSQPIKLLYLGRISHLDKGIDLIPHILQELYNRRIQFTMDIFGDGPQKEWLMKSIRKRNYSKIVYFKGMILPSELPQALLNYDFFIMPSRFEGCPRTLLEAMAAGIVPIVSNLHGVTDTIIDDRINGVLCTVGNSSAFAEAVKYLYTHPEKTMNLRLNARRKIEENYALRFICKLYQDLFADTRHEPPYTGDIKPIDTFQPIKKLYSYHTTWRARIPYCLKKLILTYKERFRLRSAE